MGVKISKSKTMEKLNCVQPFSSSNRTSLVVTPVDFSTDVEYHISPRTHPEPKPGRRDKNDGQSSKPSSSLKPNDSLCCQPCSCVEDIVAFAALRCPIHIKEALIPVVVQSRPSNAAPETVDQAYSPVILVEALDGTADSYHPPTPPPGQLTPSNSSVSLHWSVGDEDEVDYEKNHVSCEDSSADLKNEYLQDCPHRPHSPPLVPTGEAILDATNTPWSASFCQEMAALAGNHAKLVDQVAEVQNWDALKPVLHVKPWANPNKALFHIPRRVTTLPGGAPSESAHSLPSSPVRVSFPNLTFADRFEIRIKAENTFRIQVEAVRPTQANMGKVTRQTGFTPLTPVEVRTFCSFGSPTVVSGSSLTSDPEGGTGTRRRCQSSTQYEILSATGFTHRSKPLIYVTSETGVETFPSQHPDKPVSVSRRLVYNAATASPDPSRHMPAVAGGGSSKDDSSLSCSSGNGDLAKPETLTIVRRSGKKNTPTVRNPTMVEDLDNINLESLELDIENTPVDTVEACDKSAFRLKCLLRLLQTKREIPVEVLQRNLEFATRVLDAVYSDESRTAVADPTVNLPVSLVDSSLTNRTSSGTLPRSLCPPEFPGSTKRQKIPALLTRRFADDEDELSEVQPDAVPPEVRAWLASTFTRHSVGPARRSGEEKPKFRSVAQAIRAGIFVERIYRRMSSSSLLQFPSEVARHLKMIDEWSFDVFALSEASGGSPLRYLGIDLLNRYGVLHKFKIPTNTLENFLTLVEAGYSKYRNLYHNSVHAADVCQTVSYMLCQTGLMNWLTDLEIFAAIISAIIHDYEHTGQTNSFHIMSGSDTALLYNDRAVLENHHVCAAFKLMKEEDCNILVNLSREDYREFRSLVIDMVLATDMSGHFQQIKSAKALLTMPDVSIDKSKALSLMLHCCDVAHPGKPWSLHQRWTDLLLEEFFRQGDLEKEMGLPYSPLCDRNTTLVAESQIGFIDFIVEPSLAVLGDLLERILIPRSPLPAKTERESISEETADNDGNKKGSKDKDYTVPSVNAAATELDSARTTVPRPWKEHLAENKAKWKELSAKENRTHSTPTSEDDATA